MSTPGRLAYRYNVFTTEAATGTGKAINVSDYRNVIVRIGTASSANLTLKAQGAIRTNIETSSPDFSATQTVANNWDYVQMVDLSDGSAINGATGFVASGTDKFKLYEINTNALDYICFTVTAISAGSVTVDILLTDNL